MIGKPLAGTARTAETPAGSGTPLQALCSRKSPRLPHDPGYRMWPLFRHPERSRPTGGVVEGPPLVAEATEQVPPLRLAALGSGRDDGVVVKRKSSEARSSRASSLSDRSPHREVSVDRGAERAGQGELVLPHGQELLVLGHWKDSRARPKRPGCRARSARQSPRCGGCAAAGGCRSGRRSARWCRPAGRNRSPCRAGSWRPGRAPRYRTGWRAGRPTRPCRRGSRAPPGGRLAVAGLFRQRVDRGAAHARIGMEIGVDRRRNRSALTAWARATRSRRGTSESPERVSITR